MVDKLALMTGVDIPFEQAGLIIHQPRLKEMGLVNESVFFKGLDLLLVDKEKLHFQDKNDLNIKSNFDILMTIVKEGQEDEQMMDKISAIPLVLTLLFPEYEPSISEQGIILMKEGDTPKFISQMNFDSFQEILNDVFCLSDPNNKRAGYNPSGPKARELAEKFRRRAEKLNKGKEQFSFYEKIISVLSVALYKTAEEIAESFTIYQVHKIFERYNKKDAWDTYINSKIQGASGMDDVENWLNDLF